MAFDEIWGGRLIDVVLDISRHWLLLKVDVLESGVLEQLELEFEGVFELRFTDVDESPWAYAEVTAVDITDDNLDTKTVRVVLWSESASMTVRCRAVRLNDRSTQMQRAGT